MKNVKLVHLSSVGGDLYVMRPFHAPEAGQGLPDGGAGIPDNSLPDYPPPTPPEGMVVVLVRTPDGKWKYAAMPTAGVPAPLPEPTPEPKAGY